MTKLSNGAAAPRWHDLKDDLTEAQILYLERAEVSGLDTQAGLVLEAQDAAIGNFGTRILFGALPIPRGVTALSLARYEPYAGWFRTFRSNRQIIGRENADSVQVSIHGQQFADGRVEGWIELSVDGDEPDDYSCRHLEPGQARAVAHMLLNAVNQIAPGAEADPIGVLGADGYSPEVADPSVVPTVENVHRSMLDSSTGSPFLSKRPPKYVEE